MNQQQTFAKVYFIKDGKCQATRRVAIQPNLNLQEFLNILKKFFNIGNTETVVLQYLDNENEWVDFSEEEEWKSILLEQCPTPNVQKVFKIKAISGSPQQQTGASAFSSASSSSTSSENPINVFKNNENDIIVDVDVNKVLGGFLPFMQSTCGQWMDPTTCQQQQQQQPSGSSSTQGFSFPKCKGHFHHPYCCGHHHFPGWGRTCGSSASSSSQQQQQERAEENPQQQQQDKLDEQSAIFESFQTQKPGSEGKEPEKQKQPEVEVIPDEEMTEIGEKSNPPQKEMEKEVEIEPFGEDFYPQKKKQEEVSQEKEKPKPKEQEAPSSSSQGHEHGFNFGPWGNWWNQMQQWGQMQQQRQRQMTEEEEIALAIAESLKDQEKAEQKKKDQQ